MMPLLTYFLVLIKQIWIWTCNEVKSLPIQGKSLYHVTIWVE